MTNEISGREALGLTPSRPRRIAVLAGLIAIVIASALIVSSNVTAHDIDLEQARQKLEDYARSVAQENNYRADVVNRITCNKEYPHQVICFIGYRTQDGKDACTEGITVYFKSHSGSKRDWTYYTAHRTRAKCGRYLSGPNP